MSGDLRICFIGDSYVSGTGDPDCLGWTGRLCVAANRSGHKLTYYNLGIRGETSADIAARWVDEVPRRWSPGRARLVVCSFGVNDTSVEAGRRRLPLMQSLQQTRQIVSMVRQGATVLVVGPPPVADMAHNARIEELSRGMAEVCGQAGVPFLAVHEPLLASTVWMHEVTEGDGAHPRAKGYEEWARLVEPWPPWIDALRA